jgi:hypothetical protein
MLGVKSCFATSLHPGLCSVRAHVTVNGGAERVIAASPQGERSTTAVVPALHDVDRGIGHAVNEPIFFINASRPIAAKVTRQRFGFADAGEWRAQALGNACSGSGLVLPHHLIALRLWRPPM